MKLVIPSYNQAEFLPDAIESALNQKLPFSEIIVVDDGSTDGSLEIARKYPVTVIAQVNKGLASARNTGIMNAGSTSYIAFLDADDILLEKYTEVIWRTIKETEDDIIAPSFKTFGIENKEILLEPSLTLKDFEHANRAGYFSCFKRSALLEIGGYSPRMEKGYEDYHLLIDLLKRGKTIRTLPDILVLYRTREHSMIHDALKHHEELLAQIKKDHPQLYV